jgi:hypothetical protein
VSRAWRQSGSSWDSQIHAAAPINAAQPANSTSGNSGRPARDAAIPQRQKREVQQQPAEREEREQALRAKALDHRRAFRCYS